MQKEKALIVKKQKDRWHQLQLSLRQFNSRHDPLWHQTPEMGAEGLIATLDSERELQKILKGIMKRKKQQRRALLLR